MKKYKEESSHQFTILYFISIIMIVGIHSYMGGVSILYEWFHPYNFVIPIFVFASGYFFYKSEDRTSKSIILNKIKKLLIPFFLWNVFYGLIIFIFKKFGFINYGADFNFENIFLSPLYSGQEFELNIPSWYIVPIFMVQIFAIFFKKLLKNKKGPYIIFILYLILGMIGLKLVLLGYRDKWWLTLARFLHFLPFFGLGILYKYKLEKYVNKIPNYIYFPVVIGLELIMIYLKGGMPNYTPAWMVHYDNVINSFIFGFLGIAFWLRVSKILVPSLKNSKIVNLISKNTFSIMLHHVFGFFVLNICFIIISKYFIPLEGFDFQRFQNNVWYEYAPKNLHQFKTVYLVFGIAFSLFVAFISNKFKKYFLKIFDKVKNIIIIKIKKIYKKS